MCGQLVPLALPPTLRSAMYSLEGPGPESTLAHPESRAELTVMEKTTADVMFVTTKGVRRTAKAMFLSSRALDEAAAGGLAEEVAARVGA